MPAGADWQAAASFVRAQWKARDLISVAPAWADPLLRRALGDRIDLAMAGRSDSAGYERLWAISIRGAQPPEVGPERGRRGDRAAGGEQVVGQHERQGQQRHDGSDEAERRIAALTGGRGTDCVIVAAAAKSSAPVELALRRAAGRVFSR